MNTTLESTQRSYKTSFSAPSASILSMIVISPAADMYTARTALNNQLPATIVALSALKNSKTSSSMSSKTTTSIL